MTKTAKTKTAKCYSCGHKWHPRPATIVSKCSVCGSRNIAEVAGA